MNAIFVSNDSCTDRSLLVASTCFDELESTIESDICLKNYTSLGSLYPEPTTELTLSSGMYHSWLHENNHYVFHVVYVST